MNIKIDTLAYSSQLRHLHPAQKLWFALAVLLLAMLAHSPVQICIFSWMSIWIVAYAGIPVRIYGAMMLGVLVFVMMSMPAIIFNYTSVMSSSIQADSWWQMNFLGGQLYLSRQGLIHGIEVLLRSLSSTSALFFIVLTIPAIELATNFQAMGCPSILIELSLLIYRFIFLLASTAQTMITAQISRCGYRTHRRCFYSLNLLVGQLLKRTASRYQQLILGVKSRGLQQEFRFWQPHSYQYSKRYARESLSGCLLLVIGEITYRYYV